MKTNIEQLRTEILEYINNYNQPEKLTIERISKTTGISCYYLNRIQLKDIIKKKNESIYKPLYQQRRKERRKEIVKNRTEFQINNDKQKVKEWVNKQRVKKYLGNYVRIKDLLAKYLWKRIEGYENYIINNIGIVINVNNLKVNKQQKNNLGYMTISVGNKQHMIHRLVGKAFIPNPQNKPEINHKNGKRDDNRVENLEWVTRQENVQHSFRELGRISNLKGKGRKRGCKHSEATRAKMKESQRIRHLNIKIQKI